MENPKTQDFRITRPITNTGARVQLLNCNCIMGGIRLLMQSYDPLAPSVIRPVGVNKLFVRSSANCFFLIGCLVMGFVYVGVDIDLTQCSKIETKVQFEEVVTIVWASRAKINVI